MRDNKEIRAEEARAAEAIRAYFVSDDAVGRAITLEWLAGRLGIRLSLCEAALARLESQRVIRRKRRPDRRFIYVKQTRSRSRIVGHVLVAVIALAITGVAIFVALNARYVFVAGEALAIGLMVAFAWLDAELRDGSNKS